MFFHLRRFYRTTGVAGTLGFLAWSIMGLCLALLDPDIPNRLAAVAMFGGIPLLMAGGMLWVLVAYYRHGLIIDGGRVAVRGVVRRREVDLWGVTEARWRIWPDGGSLVLRDDRARIVIDLDYYEAEERERIVGTMRSVLRPDVQVGWNLFAYKIEFREPRPARTEPGPGEIVLNCRRWNRIFVPSFVVMTLAGVIAWWSTGEPRGFMILPLLLVFWAFLRYQTPAEGTVVKKVSATTDPEGARFLRFLLLWFLVCVAALLALDHIRDRMAHPDVVLILVGVFLVGGLLLRAHREDARRARRDREAADLAAIARGEADATP